MATVPATPAPSAGLLTASSLLSTSLGALEILSAGIGNPEIGVAAEIAAEVVPLIEAAIGKLMQVKNSPVTLGQLEKLRFTPRW